MPYSRLNDLPADVAARAARVKLACFDVDGVLTDGRLWYGAGGESLKAFHVHDGLGLKLLMQAGVATAIVTARQSDMVEARGRELGFTHVCQGVKDKLALVSALAQENGISLDECAFVGDDLPDLSAMRAVGLSIAVANAHLWVRERAHWRTQRAGGEGAVREVCDLLLGARGEAESVLAKFLGA
jgi:3-deoxy-D-manno-octulosonate 8-phosphate phosphatase (KDO 8-P phosphatase)